MSNDKWDATFEEFITNIVLTNTQANRIDSSLYNLSRLFLERLDVEDIDIYIQGSFATNTTVKPLTNTQTMGDAGEYDVDIVIDSVNWGEAEEALSNIEAVLNSHESYSDKISNKKKNSCVRLDYNSDDSGVGFHVDIVPIKTINETCMKANRKTNDWTQSETKKLSNWINNFADNNLHFRSTVLTLKRLRDVLGITNELPSTILVVLTAYNYIDRSSHIDDFFNCLGAICKAFELGADSLIIDNPVQDEDLAQRYKHNINEYNKIGSKLRKAYNELTNAFSQGDLDIIQQYLSDDFPKFLPQNVHSLRSQNASIQTDGSFENADIVAESHYGRTINPFKHVFFETSKPILFIGELKYSKYKILWQVCNAATSKQLRGNWFHAKSEGGKEGSSNNPLRNAEKEVYIGEHWTRYVVIDSNNKAVALSKKYKVEVIGSGPGYHK
jgi:hypothetical protein